MGHGREVYGRSQELREFLEGAGIGYVFAVPVDHQVTTSGGVRMRADQALALVEAHGWNRRSTANPNEIAYFYAYAPEHRACSLTDLVKIAGTRWKGEDDFQDSKIHRRTRPDPGQTLPGVETACHRGDGGPRVPRRGRGHRAGRTPRPILPEDPEQLPPADCGTIALTVPETQRLFHLLTTLTRDLPPHAVRTRITRHLNWSDWRRRHQARARARARWHHYRTRLALTA